MKNISTLLIASVALILGSTAIASQTSVHKGAAMAPKVTAHAHPDHAIANASKARGDMTKNPNIKVASPVNVEGKPAPNHSKKGGTHRGALATQLHINNLSGYYINITLDGQSIGTVAPYGDSYAWEPSGSHTLYGQAPGTTYQWGPSVYWFSEGGTFLWTLNPPR